MGDSDIVLSAPLQQLKDEHVVLQATMDRFYETTEEIEINDGATVIQLFGKLYNQVAAFAEKLQAHSKREEEGLFPMMTRQLEGSDNIIEVMEEEHDKAEGHLQDFLTAAEHEESNIEEDDAKAITVYAVQAYTTLTQHFAKEEKVLFPLAEKILSAAEKAELERLFRA